MTDAGHEELLAAVDELAAAMKAKLEANRHKGGRIEDETRVWLVGRLRDEVFELDQAVYIHERDLYERPWADMLDDVKLEAADVANFALTIWVRARRLQQKAKARVEQHPGAPIVVRG